MMSTVPPMFAGEDQTPGGSRKDDVPQHNPADYRKEPAQEQKTVHEDELSTRH